METTIETPYALYTDRVRLPQVEDLSSNSPIVRTKQFDDSLNEHSAVYFRTLAQSDALKAMLENPPKTVGDLWIRYLQTLANYSAADKNLSALESGMSKVAEAMNEYADNQDWCSDYEYQLNEFNGMLSNSGYNGWFSFEGRKVDMRVRVERTREVREYIWIDMEVSKGEEVDYDYATDIASEMDIDAWCIDDDHYNESNYEVTDTETI